MPALHRHLLASAVVVVVVFVVVVVVVVDIAAVAAVGRVKCHRHAGTHQLARSW